MAAQMSGNLEKKKAELKESVKAVYGSNAELESKLESEFGIKSYIEINNDSIKVVINSKEHDAVLANNIMRCVQKEFDSKKYITVTFE